MVVRGIVVLVVVVVVVAVAVAVAAGAAAAAGVVVVVVVTLRYATSKESFIVSSSISLTLLFYAMQCVGIKSSLHYNILYLKNFSHHCYTLL